MRMLKGKRFGPFFRRVPSLELLDDLNRRLVAWGFNALSLTLLTGGVGSRRRLRPDSRWSPAELAVVVALDGFGVVLQLRMLAAGVAAGSRCSPWLHSVSWWCRSSAGTGPWVTR
jgi:hypothetical protein